MMINRRRIINANFELVSPKRIMTNHGNYTWLNEFQFQSSNIWKNNTITKKLIDEYNEKLSVNK